MEEGLSRREIIKGVGLVGIGAAFAKIGGMVSKAEAKGGKHEKWPWPYEKLDPAKTAEIAYNEWYRVFCGAAVIGSIFMQLRDKFGEPYASFPIDSFIFLEGGNVGWGTICGSNAGASVVSNVIIGPRIANVTEGHEIADEILEWYSKTAMPVFVPKDPRSNKTGIIKTTSNSPLCHVSVGRWMKASGKSIGSDERKDRCARVAASVAYRTVELLNDWKDGKYHSSATWTPVKSVGITAQQNCGNCHGSSVPMPPMKK